MKTKDLMSGIAVVIDDEFDNERKRTADAPEDEDLICKIVDWFERAWSVPFVTQKSLPPKALWPNLLGAASFVLLDWRLWGVAGETLKESMIADIRDFLTSARQNLVPVFILTNESIEEVLTELGKLPNDVFDVEETKNFVFVEQKSQFWSGTSVDLSRLESWVYGNSSVYALKTWHQLLDRAKAEVFRAMCQRNVNWPRVFWKTYIADGAEPSSSLTNLINDTLWGRMRVNAFKDDYLGDQGGDVSASELRQLIVETSFRQNHVIPPDEVRCGDLFAGGGKYYWLNLRPDCDCIPRGADDVGDIDVYCVRGKRLGPSEERKLFNKNGYFEERVTQSVVFGVVDEKSILFEFDKLRVCKYSEVRNQRVGRLLHPYVTRVQQRYALYIQRQALPRIPEEAVAVIPNPATGS
ncbi:MAG: hypothetical protein OXC12_00295 [Spirochaetaceae bacterium]|nr:hypothetical protein [Spirochaetaceae bacterium]